MTEPAGAIQDPQAAHREAQIFALEAAVMAAATVGLISMLDHVAAGLRAGFEYAVTEPGRWLAARRRAARTLQSTRSHLVEKVERLLPRAAALGARQAGGVLPDGYTLADVPLLREMLDSLDQDADRRLAAAARFLLEARIHTRPQLDTAVARVEAVRSHIDAGVGGVVTRTVAAATQTVAQDRGVALTWFSERGACLVCTSLNGSVAAPGDLFSPVQRFTPRARAVILPPAHPHCRCHVAVASQSLVAALRREGQREVARGESQFDPNALKLAAVDRLLGAGATRLPKTVTARARADRARGQFSRRDLLSAR